MIPMTSDIAERDLINRKTEADHYLNLVSQDIKNDPNKVSLDTLSLAIHELSLAGHVYADTIRYEHMEEKKRKIWKFWKK